MHFFSVGYWNMQVFCILTGGPRNMAFFFDVFAQEKC